MATTTLSINSEDLERFKKAKIRFQATIGKQISDADFFERIISKNMD